MNESKLQEIARLCAFCFGQDHDYTPNHADEEWQAHGWVIEAMKAALAAAPTPAPVPVDPAELEALRRDAARLDWLEDMARCYWVDVQRQPDGKMIFAGEGPGLREAIDAARANEAQP